jgi:hypothetical protein
MDKLDCCSQFFYTLPILGIFFLYLLLCNLVVPCTREGRVSFPSPWWNILPCGFL